MPRLPPSPQLEWSADGAPRSLGYDDVYFSRAGGLAESEAVFLAGCGLPEAWRGRRRFAICELGFGAGLNVLAAWRAWKSTRSPHALLHISSIEAFPLARPDAARALACFPELGALADRLLARWPVRAHAPQRLWFPDDGFVLTLFTGEAETILADLRAQFDAWFLDGFAPARNPAMWTPETFRHIARLSAPGARLATFTVAGEVRRSLIAHGFDVAKRPGFGAKRERLEARLQAPAPAPAPLFPYATPDSISPNPVAPKRVAIIGAGVAGAACAQSLALRGVETVVLEAARELGAGASGNPAALVMPRLDRGAGPLSTFHLAAFIAAVAAFDALGEEAFTSCGVEQLPDARGACADLLSDPPLPDDWLSPAPNGAMMHIRAGVVRPLAAIKAMLRQAKVQFEAEVAALGRAGDGWVLRATDGRAMLKADAVVLACGAGLARFAPAQFLPLEFSRGQIEWGQVEGSAALQHARTQGAYVAPFADGIVFGSTFDRVDADATIACDEASRARNLNALEQLAPEIAAKVVSSKLASRASLRAATPDRAPIAGLAPDAGAWRARYADPAAGRSSSDGAAAAAYEGVYVLGGLGARGFTTAPVLGERIASEICGEPPSLPQSVLDAIHPARFLHRALKRR